MSDTPKRFLTALVLLPAVLFAIWSGGLAFIILLGIIGLALIWESIKILDDRATSPLAAIYVMVLLGILLHFWASGTALTASMFALVGVGALGAWLIALLHQKNKWLAGAGVLYLLTPFILLVDLHSGTHGAMALMVFLCLVWASDTGAYFVGRTIGGPKLAPQISENKTWSGAVGGLAASVLVGGAFIAFGFGQNLWLWAVLISLATQVGDLLESYLKRWCKIKDSSNFLPGHGGVLDRVDGLLFAIMVLYAVFFFLDLEKNSAAQLLLTL